MGLLLLVILLVLVFGGFPVWGAFPSGILGLVVIILIILLIMGKL